MECRPSSSSPVLAATPSSGGRWPTGWPTSAPFNLFHYPGFGGLPAEPSIHSLDDFFGWLVERLPPGASHIIAQSMGGVLAVRLALEHPERIARLVLVATSGDVDVARSDRPHRPPGRDPGADPSPVERLGPGEPAPRGLVPLFAHLGRQTGHGWREPPVHSKPLRPQRRARSAGCTRIILTARFHPGRTRAPRSPGAPEPTP